MDQGDDGCMDSLLVGCREQKKKTDESMKEGRSMDGWIDDRGKAAKQKMWVMKGRRKHGLMEGTMANFSLKTLN